MPISSAPARAAGLLALSAAVAAAELVHAVARPAPSLLHVVDQAAVRATPGAVSRQAIEAVGTADKPLITAATFVSLAAVGLWLGPAARRRAWVAVAVFSALAVTALACAGSLDGISLRWAAAATAAACITGVGTLRGLLALAVDPPGGPQWPGSGVSRRGFLVVSSGVAAAAATGVLGAPALRRTLVGQQRDDVVLPPPAEPAAPAAADLATPGISSLVTSNRRFYRIDEALVVPTVDLRSWRLRVTGMVDRPFEVSLQDLLAEPLVERWVTLACVSNDLGGKLVGNARWLGVRLSRLLDRAGVQAGATQVVGRSVDGFTTGFPVAAALDGRDALVAVGMNGEPLPYAHGFPARLVVPGLYGMVSATKWLRELELTTWDFDPYWPSRGWAKQAPIKVQSRIDTPRDYAVVPAGRLPLAGVAWAPTHGIAQVDLRVDGGPWQPALLGSPLSDACWRQWQLAVDLAVGHHEIEVRARTNDGLVQDSEQRSAFPSGATGLHRLHVRCATA